MSISRSVRTILDQQPVALHPLGRPTNDADVLHHIFHFELKREVAALRALPKKPDTFKKRFTERCKWRATHPDEAIAFNIDPESPTNKLYFQIATAVFAPQTMKDLLQILMPTTTKHFEVDLNFDSNKKIAPVFRRHANLDNLTHAPTLQTLTSLVFLNDTVFNTEDISNFSLQLHDAFNKKLTLEFPALAEQLYEHNHHFKTLSADLHLYNRNGMTPREAITELINGCVLGGSSNTGDEFASTEAQNVYFRFFDYLKTLPEETEKALNNGEFKSYLNDFKKGSCVECAASGFLRFLNRYPKPYALLDTPPQMPPETLQTLTNKYGKNRNLILKKEFVSLQTFPQQLSKIAFKQITPKYNDEWGKFLINFPNVFYHPVFWQQVKFTNIEIALNTILILKNRVYTDRQHVALFNSIAKNYTRFNGSVLDCVVPRHDMELLQIALNIFSSEQQILEITKSNNISGNTALHNAYRHRHIFYTLLTIIPIDQRYRAVNIKNKAGVSVLDEVIRLIHIRSLQILLDLLPERDRLALLNKQTLKKFILEDITITLQDSYFSEYLSICKCIKSEITDHPFTFFSHRGTEAKALFNSIITLNNPQTIRAKLFEYIADHSETPLARDLLKIMNDSAVAQPRFHLLPS